MVNILNVNILTKYHAAFFLFILLYFNMLFYCETLIILSFGKFSFSQNNTGSQKKSNEKPQVIILKLDDVVAQESPDGLPVSPRWQRVVDYLQKSEIKSTLGIIGYSLEQDNEAYFNWIRKVNQGGYVEFWNHGYREKKNDDEPGEFESNSAENQRKALLRTQNLAREKLGIEFEVFGAHWSGTNSTTVEALKSLPQIKRIFYSPDDSMRFVFERVMTLEDPVHVPDFEKFKATYNRVGVKKPYLALQGHPRSWDGERWDNFVKIIEFLKSKGVVFMTASEYAEKNE